MSPRSSQAGTGFRGIGTRWFSTGVAVVVVACAVFVTTSSSAGPFTHDGYDFVTRPDLHPPRTEVMTQPKGTAEGNILSAPINPTDMGVGAQLKGPAQAGAMLSDNSGDPLWFHPAKPGQDIMDLQMQQYQGKPVLTYWQGKLVVPPGYGKGEGVIMDQHYNKIATVHPGNGIPADIHDFVITPQNTALLLGYQEKRADLSSVGGPKNGKYLDCVVQEVDIATGKVLLNWRASDHVGLDESYQALPSDPTKEPWDYFHVNSVDVDSGGGNLLISSRNTSTVYQVNRTTGQVNWRLNGKKTDFSVPPEAQFQWQHDVERLPDGTITIFDNAVPEKLRSRGVQLRVDENARTADEVRSDWRPAPIVSGNMGNFQLLENGDAFLGWGGSPGMSEIGADDSVRYEAQLANGMTSYRAYRVDWVGQPLAPPDVVAKPAPKGHTTVYTSWNGATEVSRWRVLAGSDAKHLRPVQDSSRTGFETKIDVPVDQPYVTVQALDDTGKVIGQSKPVEVS